MDRMRPTRCPNCEYPLAADHAYCASCGQQVIGEDSLGSFITHFLGDYFTFDSKIIRSLVPLVLKPGFLTNEFRIERRARYIPPLRMFIFLSVLFFLVIGWSSSSNELTDSDQLQEQVFWDRFFGSVLPKMIFLFMPCMALLTFLFHRRTKTPLLIAFVASMHFHAFVFLTFGVYGLVSGLFRATGALAVNRWLITALCGYTLYYLWRSLKTIYQEPPLANALKFVGLLVVYLMLLIGASVFAVWVLS